jgi:hypothetical protein
MPCQWYVREGGEGKRRLLIGHSVPPPLFGMAFGRFKLSLQEAWRGRWGIVGINKYFFSFIYQIFRSQSVILTLMIFGLRLPVFSDIPMAFETCA